MRQRHPSLLHIAIATLFFTTGPRSAEAATIEKPVPGAGTLVQHRPVKAVKLRGPFERTEKICATLRKSVCQSWRDRRNDEADLPLPRSTCTRLEVKAEGALSPPFLEVQGLQATCGETGETDGEVRLVFRTADGWYLGPQQPVEYEDRKVTEQTFLNTVRTQEVDGALLLLAPVRYRCILDPAKIEGLDELTSDAEQLVVIGIGPTGSPSALTYELGSALRLLLRPNQEEEETEAAAKKKIHRQGPRLSIDESIDIGWHVRSGNILQLDEPQGSQRIKPAQSLPYDIPCTDSVSFVRRLKQARKLAGVYPMKFQ